MKNKHIELKTFADLEQFCKNYYKDSGVYNEVVLALDKLKTFNLSDKTIEKVYQKAPYFWLFFIRSGFLNNFDLEKQILKNEIQFKLLNIDVYVLKFNNFVKANNGFSYERDFHIKSSLENHILTILQNYFLESLKCSEMNGLLKFEKQLAEIEKEEFIPYITDVKQNEIFEKYLEHLDFYYNRNHCFVINFLNLLSMTFNDMHNHYSKECKELGYNPSCNNFIYQYNKTSKEINCSILDIQYLFKEYVKDSNCTWEQIARFSFEECVNYLNNFKKCFKRK